MRPASLLQCPAGLAVGCGKPGGPPRPPLAIAMPAGAAALTGARFLLPPAVQRRLYFEAGEFAAGRLYRFFAYASLDGGRTWSGQSPVGYAFQTPRRAPLCPLCPAVPCSVSGTRFYTLGLCSGKLEPCIGRMNPRMPVMVCPPAWHGPSRLAPSLQRPAWCPENRQRRRGARQLDPAGGASPAGGRAWT